MVLRTVAHGAPAEAVALLQTREAAAHGVAAHIHLLSGFKVGDGDAAAQGKALHAVNAVLAQVTEGLLA